MKEKINLNGIYDEKKIKIMQTKLINWGKMNIRKYPWRETSDLYKIVIAEIMLQRTKSDQVRKRYLEFIKKYPDFNSIYRAGLEKIMEEFRQLGLTWRGKNLYLLTEKILKKFNGILPNNKEELLKLPGIGDYIASAVLCIAYNIPESPVDSNVVRVISRVFGIEITESARRNKQFKEIMYELTNCSKSKKFFLSMIDFASSVCTAKKPKCVSCILSEICIYGRMMKNEKFIN